MKSGRLQLLNLVHTLPVAQGDSSDGVYRAFSPGQYAHDGQTVLRTSPRLVAVRPGGAPVLRAVNGGTLKRVRVAALPANYAVEPQTQQYTIAQPQYTQQVAQPAYYVQRQPTRVAVAPKQVQVVRPAAARPVYQTAAQEEAEDEYPVDPNPQYNFSFDVKDDELTNYQNRQEERDGGVIKGSYSVVDPDGYVRTVTYTADPKNGFQAKVVREPTDVKVKFPVPTESPETQAAPAYKSAARPAIRVQQFAQYPQTQQQYATQPVSVYSQQPQYTLQSAGQPTYVVRRIPGASASGTSQPRVVKVLRAQ